MIGHTTEAASRFSLIFTIAQILLLGFGEPFRFRGTVHEVERNAVCFFFFLASISLADPDMHFHAPGKLGMVQ